MGYWIKTFGTTSLPSKQEAQDLTSGPIKTNLVFLPGDTVFDPRGTEQAFSTNYPIRLSGLISASTPGSLSMAFYALLALKGLRDKLYRTPDGGGATAEYIYARCEEVKSLRRFEDKLHQTVELVFIPGQDVWNGTVRAEGGTLASSPQSLIINNAGNATQRDLVITVTAGTADITALEIENTETGHKSHITYAGTIIATEELEIDTGAITAENPDGSDIDWDDWDFGGNHGINEWIRLKSGDNTVEVTFTGGGTASYAAFVFRDAYA